LDFLDHFLEDSAVQELQEQQEQEQQPVREPLEVLDSLADSLLLSGLSRLP
jgi:hypothetical protein